MFGHSKQGNIPLSSNHNWKYTLIINCLLFISLSGAWKVQAAAFTVPGTHATVTAAINAANAAAGADTITLAAGTYTEDFPPITDALTLQGAGATTILQTVTNKLVLDVQIGDVTIQNLAVEGTNADVCITLGLDSSQSNLMVQNTTLNNCEGPLSNPFFGFPAADFGTFSRAMGILSYGGGAIIQNNTLNAANIVVAGALTNPPPGSNNPTPPVSIINNTVNNSLVGIQISGRFAWLFGDVNVTGNTVQNGPANSYGIWTNQSINGGIFNISNNTITNVGTGLAAQGGDFFAGINTPWVRFTNNTVTAGANTQRGAFVTNQVIGDTVTTNSWAGFTDNTFNMNNIAGTTGIVIQDSEAIAGNRAVATLTNNVIINSANGIVVDGNDAHFGNMFVVPTLPSTGNSICANSGLGILVQNGATATGNNNDIAANTVFNISNLGGTADFATNWWAANSPPAPATLNGTVTTTTPILQATPFNGANAPNAALRLAACQDIIVLQVGNSGAGNPGLGTGQVTPLPLALGAVDPLALGTCALPALSAPATTCFGQYATGSIVQLTAAPTGTSIFRGWAANSVTNNCGTSAGTNTLATTITLTAALKPNPCIANFDPTNLLTVNRAGAGTGTITSTGVITPKGLNNGLTNCAITPCIDRYSVNDNVTLTATPTGSSTFAGWSAGCGTNSGTNTPNTVVNMAAPIICTATFNPPATTTITANFAGTGSGTVTAAAGLGSGINCPGTCTETYTLGSAVMLLATPSGGSTFGGWAGADCMPSGIVFVTNATPKFCTAIFLPPPVITPGSTFYALLVINSGNGTGTVTKSPIGTNCGTDCTQHLSGTVVTLTATPSGGSTFTGWGGACSGVTNPLDVTLDAAKYCTAQFTLPVVTQTLAVTLSGNGNVVSVPPGIDCGTTCNFGFADGANITLIAGATAGNVFSGWSGDCSGIASITSVTLNAAKNCTATFTPISTTFTLIINKIGSGNVTSSPAAINCGTTCITSYPVNTAVTLTAVADPGYVFAGFSGDCAANGNVTLDANKVCTATFTPISTTFTLIVNKIGSGNVTSSPAAINCGTTCITSYPVNTAVTLTAVADPGYVFAGFSGDCAANGNVTLDANKVCTATFNAITATTVSTVQFTSPLYLIDDFANVATITVARSGSVTGLITVNYATVPGGTALAGTHYQDTNGTLTWADGDNSQKTFTINVLKTTTPDTSKTVNLLLSGLTGSGILGVSNATLTIVNNNRTVVGGGTTVIQLPNPVTLDVTIKVGQTLNFVVQSGLGERYISQQPDTTIAKIPSWDGMNGVLAISGVKVGNTQLVINDSASPPQKITFNIKVVEVTPEPITLEISVKVGQTFTLIALPPKDNSQQIIDKQPDAAVATVTGWEAGSGRLTIQGMSVGKTQMLIRDTALLPRVANLTINVVPNDATTVSCLVNATRINPQGQYTTSPTCFIGKIRTQSGLQPRRAMVAHSDTLEISATATIDPQDVGKTAELLIVGVYKNFVAQANYMRVGQQWVFWDEKISSLQAAQSLSALPTTLDIPIFNGRLANAPGEFIVYIGYRLNDGTIVFNGIEPMQFYVGNSTSIDLQQATPKTPLSNDVYATSYFEPWVNNQETGKAGNHQLFAALDTLNVLTRVRVDSRHVGQAADILMVATRIRTFEVVNYTRVSNVWQRWDERLDGLQPVKRYAQLPAILEIPIYLGSLLDVPGEYIVYVGYRLDNNVIFFNGLSPVHLTVANGFGVDAQGKPIATLARFIGWIYRNNIFTNPFVTSATLPVGLASHILIDPQHSGQRGDVLMFARREFGNITYSYQRGMQQWSTWDEHFASLKAAIPNVLLEEVLRDIRIFQGGLDGYPGKYTVYIGYRLANGTVIYNGGETLDLTVLQ